MHSSLIYVLITLINISHLNAVHLQGTFKTNEFFKFITRFGFQPTDVHDELTAGYIYGNITIIDKDYFGNYSQNEIPSITLVMLDYNYFIDYYNRRLIRPRTAACSMMFEKIDKIAYYRDCHESGREDFIRRIPCENNKLCPDEDTAENVIPGYQFTFKIRDNNQARFW